MPGTFSRKMYLAFCGSSCVATRMICQKRTERLPSMPSRAPAVLRSWPAKSPRFNPSIFLNWCMGGKSLCRSCQTKHASFSVPGKARSHCKECATSDMIGRVQCNKCQACGKVRRAYGLPGKSASHCSHCALPGMEKKYGLCTVCRKTTAWYGSRGKQTHCAQCRAEGMVGMKYCPCGKHPSYGYKAAVCCGQCRAPDMENLKSTLCKSCGLFPGESHPKGANPKPTYLCTYCSPNSRLAHDTRESRTAAALSLRLPALTPICNRRVLGGCSRRRPDLLYDATTHFVVVEVDEDQHRHYDRGCEHRRMIEIGQDCGMPTIFIRYNPDEWLMKGIVQEVAEDARLGVLAECLSTAMRLPIQPGVSAVWLYYNDMDVRTTTIVE